jgi:phenylalanyl-tRNA synthetase alpha chain
MKFNEQLRLLEAEASSLLKSAQSTVAIESIRVQFLGKKGQLSALLASLKGMSPEERKQAGQESNRVKEWLESSISERASEFEREELSKKLETDHTDASLPGVSFPLGARHPLSLVLDEVIGLLRRAGLEPQYGPEVEWEEYCFDRLNFKPGHAARDMQATFFVDSPSEKSTILRTHTSPVQVRALLAAAENKISLPLAIQAPGRVYRVDDDATHAPMFHQIEGLFVNSTASMGDLRATLDFFFRNFFGTSTKIRFRPSYFPFTEPSAEVDVSCVFCSGKGCRICKESGWLEVAGAGLVHPQVFVQCGWDPQKVQGWAFGMGIERLAMLKRGIPDLRLFFENRLSFIRGRA